MYNFYNHPTNNDNDVNLRSKEVHLNLSPNEVINKQQSNNNNDVDAIKENNIDTSLDINVPKKTKVNNTSNYDDLQKARQDLIGELHAIVDYDKKAREANDRLAQETWQDIRNEELVHVGELLALLDYLDSTQRQFVEKGIKEFNDRLNNT